LIEEAHDALQHALASVFEVNVQTVQNIFHNACGTSMQRNRCFWRAGTPLMRK
jgi:hypothetical protein